MTSFEIALDFLTIQSNCFEFFNNSVGSCFWTMESRKSDLTVQSDFFFIFSFPFMTSFEIALDFLTIQSYCFEFFNNSVGSCFWTMESRKSDLTVQSDFFCHFFFIFYFPFMTSFEFALDFLTIQSDCFGFFNNSVGSCF